LPPNQSAEQIAPDRIDLLSAFRRIIQYKKQAILAADVGAAVRENHTDISPADYILFVNRKPICVIKAKRKEEAVRLTMQEEQIEGYAKAKLKIVCKDEISVTFLNL